MQAEMYSRIAKIEPRLIVNANPCDGPPKIQLVISDMAKLPPDSSRIAAVASAVELPAMLLTSARKISSAPANPHTLCARTCQAFDDVAYPAIFDGPQATTP